MTWQHDRISFSQRQVRSGRSSRVAEQPKTWLAHTYVILTRAQLFHLHATVSHKDLLANTTAQGLQDWTLIAITHRSQSAQRSEVQVSACFEWVVNCGTYITQTTSNYEIRIYLKRLSLIAIMDCSLLSIGLAGWEALRLCRERASNWTAHKVPVWWGS